MLHLHLPDDHMSYALSVVEAAMRKAIKKLYPGELARSITWDFRNAIQRIRLGHVDFTVATGIPIYFCDPDSHMLATSRIQREHERTCMHRHT